MELRKIFLFLGLLLAPLSGGSIYYLYHLQTKEVTILQVKPNLEHIIEPGTKLTNDLLKTEVILQKDLPPDAILPGSLDDQVYAAKYLYPSDPLLKSKVTNEPMTYKQVNQRIVSIKPMDLGLMGLVQLNDLITIETSSFTLTNVKVVGTADSSGTIQTIIPQFTKADSTGSSLLNITNTAQPQAKAIDHLLVLVSKEDADLISKLMLSNSKDTFTVVFEKRPTLPEAAN